MAAVWVLIFHHTLMMAQAICIANAATKMMLMTRGVLWYSM